MEDPNFEEEFQKTSKIKRSDSDLNYLEMTLVADKYTIAFHGKDTAKYLLMIANLVSQIIQSFTAQLLVMKLHNINHCKR